MTRASRSGLCARPNLGDEIVVMVYPHGLLIEDLQVNVQSRVLPPRYLAKALHQRRANARALDKARTLPADGLILDMEDAVSPDAKELARNQKPQA